MMASSCLVGVLTCLPRRLPRRIGYVDDLSHMFLLVIVLLSSSSVVTLLSLYTLNLSKIQRRDNPFFGTIYAKDPSAWSRFPSPRSLLPISAEDHQLL